MLSWIFAVIFIIIGIANIILVHPVPGLFYLVLSIIYFPQTNTFLKKKFGFEISNVVKIMLFILIMWATLGVGDLMEIIESKWL